MARKTPNLVPVEIVTLSDDQTRVVSRKRKRITPEKLAEYQKAADAWWKKENDGPPPPIVWQPSQAEVEQRLQDHATAREQDRAKLLETLTDPNKLAAYCEEWRRRILGPALKTDEEWATAIVDCARDVELTIRPSMERIGGAMPSMPRFNLLRLDDVSQENVREALNVAIAWCKALTPQQPATIEWSKPIFKKELRKLIGISANTLKNCLVEGNAPVEGKIRYQAPKKGARKIQVAVADLPADLQTRFRKSAK